MPKDKLTFQELYRRQKTRDNRFKKPKLYDDRLNVAPPRVFCASSPHPLSMLESLPAEILLIIVDLLAPDEYLAMKFVSKSMNAATKRQDGASTEKLEEIFDKCVYGVVMNILEAGLSDGVKLTTLTCRWCGGCFGLFDGEKGFDDKRFVRALRKRECVPCRAQYKPDSIHLVEGDEFVSCLKCKEIKPKKDAIQPVRLGEQYDHKGALIKSIDKALGLFTSGMQGENDVAYLWLCRDCLGRAMKKAVRDMDMQSLQALVPESEDSYYQVEVFGSMYDHEGRDEEDDMATP